MSHVSQAYKLQNSMAAICLGQQFALLVTVGTFGSDKSPDEAFEEGRIEVPEQSPTPSCRTWGGATSCSGVPCPASFPAISKCTQCSMKELNWPCPYILDHVCVVMWTLLLTICPVETLASICWWRAGIFFCNIYILIHAVDFSHHVM